MPVSLIAAVADNRVIGRDGDLPWRLPRDLRRFQKLTTGHHLIVGRRTWESIGRPLPDRTFVVVSRERAPDRPGVCWVGSVAEGIRLAIAAGDSEPFVAGGSGIFREAFELDLVDRLHLTLVRRSYEGDAHFPEWDESRWELVLREAHPAEPEADRPAIEFRVYERQRAQE